MLSFSFSSFLKLLVLIFLHFVFNELSAQPTYQKKFNQDNSTDFIIGLVPVIDGGTVFLSKTALTKLDCKGKIEWAKDMNAFDFLAKGDVIITHNGDIAVSYTHLTLPTKRIV